MDHVASTYARIARQYAEAFSSPNDFLDEFIKLLPEGAAILDVGCGPGIEMEYCAAKGFSVDGIDISPEMIAIAREKNPAANIRLENILDLQPVKKYDACLASYSLIHLPKKDVPLALANIRSSLKEGGYFFVVVHEGKSEETLMTEILAPPLKMFLNIFSKQELLKLLAEAKFKIIEVKVRESASELEFPFNKLTVMVEAV